MESLPRTIYRAKGIVFLDESPDRRGVFQLVGQRTRVSVSDAWGKQTPYTHIVVIGSDDGIDADELKQRFTACQVKSWKTVHEESQLSVLDWLISIGIRL